ncbi:MAG TPA: hypothetical protein VEK38_00660 [Candidatus Bathyarchaeia archaeon]|nr:hypothetical protein [Candidatus Bathyarchaeia archaeon]
MRELSYRAGSAGIILSLIVHAVLIYLILFYYWSQKKYTPAPIYEVAFVEDAEPPTPSSPATSWVATQARKSPFAASSQVADDAEQDNGAEKEVPEKQEEKKGEQKQSEQEIQEIYEHEQAMLVDQASGREKVTQVEEQKKTVSTPAPQAKRQEQKRTVPKVQPTLAQLAQGFLTYARTEGNSAVTMEGKSGEPSAEQLKHERYIEKLNWCLQYAFQANQDKFPYRYAGPLRLKMYMALDKNAVIQELRVVASSGVSSLDRFAMELFRQASPSFPPVPSYFTQEPYVVIYTIEFSGDDNAPFSVSRS